MSESIYFQAQNRILIFHEILEIYVEGFGKRPDDIYEKYGLGIHASFQYTIEFDQFKNEFPDTYKRYLNSFLDQYISLSIKFSEFATFESYNGERHLIVGYLSRCIKEIIEYLKELIDPETKIQLNEFEQVAIPKGKQKLTREQTALLFFYLREKGIIAQPTNENMAKAISLLSGYSIKQIQEIIKRPGTPVYQLGKDNDKVNRNDFRTVISELKILTEHIEKDLKINSDKRELR